MALDTPGGGHPFAKPIPRWAVRVLRVRGLAFLCHAEVTAGAAGAGAGAAEP